MSEDTRTVRVPNVTPGAVSGLAHQPLYGDVEVDTKVDVREDADLTVTPEDDGPFDPTVHTDEEVDAYLDSLDADADRDEIERVIAAVEPVPDNGEPVSDEAPASE